MKIIIICSVNNLEAIEGELDFLKFKLSSNISRLENLFGGGSLEKGIGRVEVNKFKTGCYFYCEMDMETASSYDISEKELKILQDNITIYYGILESFISFLWFNKDNCCSLNSLFAYLPTAKRILVRKAMPFFSTNKGQEGQEIKFSIEELYAIAAMYIGSTKLFYHKNLRFKTPFDDEQKDLLERQMIPYDFRKQTRIERAFHFLLLARRSNQLPLKISFYICIYETLFYGTSTGEISHQIAERVALYFSNTRIFRHNIYKQIKEAYSVRSKYFHGNSFKGFKKDLEPIAYYLDNITRDILYRVFSKDHEIFLQNDELLEKSFLDMIFEDERKPDGKTFEDGLQHKRFSK